MSVLNIAIEIAAKDSASGVLGHLKNTVGGLGAVAGGVLTVGLGAATAGLAALAGGAAFAISEAMGAQAVMAQTEAVIRSTGGAAGMTAEEISNLALKLSGVSRFSDDAIQAGENLLLTFTNIGKDTFPAATQAMLDMATAMGTDAKGGAIQLGKALNDPTKGIAALTRVGVTFSDEQKKLIKRLQETGDMAGAQAVILAELNKEFGGSAAAAAGTFAGKLDVLKNRLSNVAEAIGGPLLSIGQTLIERFLLPAVPIIEDFGAALAGFLESIAGGDLGGAFDALMEWDSVRAILQGLGIDIYAIGPAVEGGLASLRDFAATWLPVLTQGIQDAFGWVMAHGEEIKGALIAIGAVLGGALIITALTAIGGLIAGLLSPIGLIIAAAALLGAAWAGNWGGIRDILTAFWVNTAQPILARLWDWLQVQVPLALAWLSNVWQTVLLPAIQAVWAWCQDVLFPMLGRLWDWLEVNVPRALTTLATFWETVLWPAIQAVWAWIEGTLFPMLTRLFAWLQVTIPAAIATLKDFWENTLLPAIKAVWAFIEDPLMPLFRTLVDFFNAAFTLAVTALAGLWQNVLEPAFRTVWAFIVDNLKPILEDLVDFWENTLGPKITAVKEAVLDKLPGIFQSIRDAIGWVIDKIGEAAAALSNFQLPWWLTPGSPTPFELGLRGVADALAQVRALTLPAFGGLTLANVPTPGGASTTVNHYYTVSGHYAYQDERTLTQELRLLTRLQGTRL